MHVPVGSDNSSRVITQFCRLYLVMQRCTFILSKIVHHRELRFKVHSSCTDRWHSVAFSLNEPHIQVRQVMGPRVGDGSNDSGIQGCAKDGPQQSLDAKGANFAFVRGSSLLGEAVKPALLEIQHAEVPSRGLMMPTLPEAARATSQGRGVGDAKSPPSRSALQVNGAAHPRRDLEDSTGAGEDQGGQEGIEAQGLPISVGLVDLEGDESADHGRSCYLQSIQGGMLIFDLGRRRSRRPNPHGACRRAAPSPPSTPTLDHHRETMARGCQFCHPQEWALGPWPRPGRVGPK